MEGGERCLETVPALDARVQVGILLRHRRLGNLPVIHSPDLRHGDHGDAAERAGIVTGRQHLVEAGLVYEVVAGRDLGWDPGSVDILLKTTKNA